MKRTPTWPRLIKALAVLTALAGGHGFLLLTTASLQGCVKQRCFDNLECPSPLICAPSGKCVYECVSDSDCGGGFRASTTSAAPRRKGRLSARRYGLGGERLSVSTAMKPPPDATASDAGVDGSRSKVFPGSSVASDR
jgi:hypothetical protein